MIEQINNSNFKEVPFIYNVPMCVKKSENARNFVCFEMFNFCNMRNIIPTLSDDQSWLPASAYTHTTTTGDLSSENMLLLRLREAPKILGASRPLGFYQHKTLTLI